MKKRDLERELKQLGWYFKREGGRHEIWTNGKDKIPIPRHKEVNERTAWGIITAVAEIQMNRQKRG